jgi:diguanylate cyclase (GGDEF)-like protein
MNEALRVFAVQDGLTGLYNHRHFHELLAAEIERSKRYQHEFSLLFIDVDHFMEYNEANGHLAGDKALYELADLLKKNTRRSCVVSRYGGEEFAIILPETSREGAFAIAENIRVLIAEHPFPGREKQPGGMFTVSIVVASYPQEGTDIRSLIYHADNALHKAKNKGNNRVS